MGEDGTYLKFDPCSLYTRITWKDRETGLPRYRFERLDDVIAEAAHEAVAEDTA